METMPFFCISLEFILRHLLPLITNCSLVKTDELQPSVCNCYNNCGRVRVLELLIWPVWGVTSGCLFVDLFVFGHKLWVCVLSWMDAFGFSWSRGGVLERWIWSCSWRFYPLTHSKQNGQMAGPQEGLGALDLLSDRGKVFGWLHLLGELMWLD